MGNEVKFMEHATLSSLISALEKGNKLHITVAFLNNYGNRKTKCDYNQTVHCCPVCAASKKQPNGIASCYRCRMTVQKAVVRHRKPMAGFCINGVYEYCRPVVHNDQVICVIFVGNILTQDPAQQQRLTQWVDAELLETMEQHFTPADCVETADIMASYIAFLFDRYGIENKTFDPLVENIKSYIRENQTQEIAVEELAEVFNYSTKYLGRLFKAKTGRSIKEYCNRLKIRQAESLLAETNLSIERIATQTGFNSENYFDRVFHRMTGLSPQMYRKSVNQQQKNKKA